MCKFINHSKKLARESFAGKIANAKEGKVHGGVPLLGYRKQGKYYVLEEKEVEAVRLIFNMTAQGYGYKYICDYLNGHGYRRADGRKFTWHFYEMLRNRKYIGEYVYNLHASADENKKRNRHKYKPESEIIRIPNAVPRIVDDETFYKVQSILDDRKHNPYTIHKDNSTYLLSGLLRCGNCKRAICGNNTKTHNFYYRIYRCNGNKDGCVTSSIPTDYLEDYVLKLFDSCLLARKNSSNLISLAKLSYISVHDKLNFEIESIKREIEQINLKIQEYAYAIATEADSSISKYMSQEMLRMQTDIEQLNDSIRVIADSKKCMPPFNATAVKNNAEKYLKMFEKGDFKDKKEALNKLIYVVTVDNEEIKVTINVHELLNSPNIIRFTVIENRNSVAIFANRRAQEFNFTKLRIAL